MSRLYFVILGICVTLSFCSLQSQSNASEIKSPVSPGIRFDYTAQDIKDRCDDTLKYAEAKLDKIASLHLFRTFQNTIVSIENIFGKIEDFSNVLSVLKDASPSEDVQKAAAECVKQMNVAVAKTRARSDLYRAMKRVSSWNLILEDAKLLEEMRKSFELGGASLSEKNRQEYVQLKEELTKAEVDFQQNLNEANDTIVLNDDEVEGVPESLLESLPKDSDGNYLFTLLKAAHWMPFLQNAESEEARKKFVTAQEKVVAGKNVQLLERALILRNRIAKLFGFKNHAEYVLQMRMAKSPENVVQFLEDLKKRLKPKLESDLGQLLKLKQDDDGDASAIHLWDWRYYDNQLRKQKYNIDEEELREYFPMDHVVSTVFSIYQRLLGVRFTEVKPAYAWHSEVRLFEVRDVASDELVAHFYMDLFPRENKYNHFAAYGIRNSRMLKNGKYQTPVATIIGNFPKPTRDKPSLCSHRDVETFFHEFGHIMHQTLSKTKYSSLSGFSVRTDFVEAPSQMLENWIWEPSILKLLSKHYKTGLELSDKLIKRKLATRHVNSGIIWSRQLFFATVDMAYHMAGSSLVDTTKVWNEVMQDVFLMQATQGGAPQASFGHLMGGYDAGYYGYLWSKLFAEDMFTVFKREGLVDPKIGARYRQFILAPGATEEPNILMRNFLGRDPISEPFYRSLGLDIVSDWI